MNREIKFRGIPVNGRDFVFGDLVRIPKEPGSWSDIPNSELVTCVTDSNSLTRKWVEVRSETIGQFTEEIDKFGKEIYQGDEVMQIILRRGSQTHYEDIKYEDDYIEQGDLNYILETYKLKDIDELCKYLSGISVIGNIHQ